MDDVERHLWEQYEYSPSVENRNALAEWYLPLLRNIAASVSQKIALNIEWDRDTLLSAGFPGLLWAIERFDRSRGWKFATFATRRIRGAMIDAIRQFDWVPRSERQLQKQTEHIPNEMNSFDFQEDRSWEDDHPRLVAVADVDRTLERREFWRSELKGLSQSERLMVLLYYQEDLTMKQIGRELGLSESRVSQKLKLIHELLREKRGLTQPPPPLEEIPMSHEMNGQELPVPTLPSAAEFLDGLTVDSVQEIIDKHRREVAAWEAILGVVRIRSGEAPSSPTSPTISHRVGIRARLQEVLTRSGGMSRRELGRELSDVRSGSLSATLSKYECFVKADGEWRYVGEGNHAEC